MGYVNDIYYIYHIYIYIYYTHTIFDNLLSNMTCYMYIAMLMHYSTTLTKTLDYLNILTLEALRCILLA